MRQVSGKKCSAKDIHHLLQLIHAACPSFTAAFTWSMLCANKEGRIKRWCLMRTGTGMVWQGNDIFIRGFVRLGFLERGQKRLQRHMSSIWTPLMRIICSHKVRRQGWGHLMPQRDRGGGLKAPMMSHSQGCTHIHPHWLRRSPQSWSWRHIRWDMGVSQSPICPHLDGNPNSDNTGNPISLLFQCSHVTWKVLLQVRPTHTHPDYGPIKRAKQLGMNISLTPAGFTPPFSSVCLHQIISNPQTFTALPVRISTMTCH